MAKRTRRTRTRRARQLGIRLPVDAACEGDNDVHVTAPFFARVQRETPMWSDESPLDALGMVPVGTIVEVTRIVPGRHGGFYCAGNVPQHPKPVQLWSANIAFVSYSFWAV